MSKSTVRKTRAKRSLLQEPVKKAKAIPDKCLKCATLSAEQAQAIHGVGGDGCWNPSVCYSRRSHARCRVRESRLPCPSPLRTARDTFASSRSSLKPHRTPPA
ncbi:hypothetical protein [Chroococcidiopsis sp [FACHB-1243]]|uniref:hypothetical protein n=1 Tax=Chroococcidiopsis sp. [FACHB-1243] TaxID=2692781 RepID=UPI0018EFEC3B|nr:hypothetical protein [Chroococcidiopsis sp. [FACHB-1243]]